MANVGKHASPMDAMGFITDSNMREPKTDQGISSIGSMVGVS